MNPQDLALTMKELEAVLMVSAEPISSERISEILHLSIGDAEKALELLSDFYLRHDRGFYIQKVAQGYRYAVPPDLSQVLEKVALAKSPPRLSSAALETLAIVAYRQPVSRSQIADIRGVNSDYVLKMLAARGYIETDTANPKPGTPLYYSTTPLFLERLGLFSLEELPRVEKFAPASDVAEALEASLFEGTY
ncbi:MAG: SMC-Scp complex subunit ScpB [Acidimicrobiaceae bacterium]|nr:SMC-Scp complex subunit ScpB [Acidimicrobiaceae bacterium]